MSDNDRKNRIGVNATEGAVVNSLEWQFREQNPSDYGVDAQIEVRHRGEYPSGKLIGVQIKTDSSSITYENNEYYVFNSDIKHLNYWLKHSLPIIIVHCDTKKNRILNWEHLTEDKVKYNNNSWSIKIPKNKVLDKSSEKELTKIAESVDILTRKYNILKSSIKIMEKINISGYACLEYENWVNKNYSARNIQMNIFDSENNKIDSETWPFELFPNINFKSSLEMMLPWAEIENQMSEGEIEDELLGRYCEDFGLYDDSYIDFDDFEIWKESYYDKSDFYPISKNEEVEKYELKLTLNDIGHSFLKINDYFESLDQFMK